MKRYRITISAYITADNQVEAERLALDAVNEYRQTETYMNNETITLMDLESVAECEHLLPNPLTMDWLRTQVFKLK